MVNTTSAIEVDDISYDSYKSVISNSGSIYDSQYSPCLSTSSAIQSLSASTSTHTTFNMSEVSVWSSNGAATSASSNALGWGSYMPNPADVKLVSNMQLTGPFSTTPNATSSNSAPAWGNAAAALNTQSTQANSIDNDKGSASTATGDIPGRTTPVWQGMNFGPGFQNMGPTKDSWGAAGSHDANKIGTTSSGSAWGASSPSTSVWGSLPTNSGANANTSSVSGWPNTSPISAANSSVSGVSAWEKNTQTSQWGATVPQSSWGGATVSETNAVDTPKTQPSTFAQAAGKGLNLKSNTNNSAIVPKSVEEEVISQAELLEKQRRQERQRVIDCPDGWGAKAVRQDYAWDVKVSPNTKRKQVEENKPNVWNNYNGTAIWEASKENPQVWLDSGEGSTKSDDDAIQTSPLWNNVSSGPRTPTEPSPCPWPVDKSQVPWRGANINQPPPGWNPPKPENPSWPPNGGTGVSGTGVDIGKDNSWNQQSQSDLANWPPSCVSDQKPAQWPSSQGMTMPNVSGVVPLGKPISGPGWGNSSPPISLKSDDGTHIWGSTPPAPNANAPPQGNWSGDASAQWINGQPKKMPPLPPGSSQSWSESSDPNWMAIRKASESSLREGSSYGSESDVFSETDTGTWNDTTQEANSTWSSASGWKNRANSVASRGTPRFPLPTNNGPPQMRAKQLQQLLDRGYKKEDALNALITNNNNLESAIADLRVRGIVPDRIDGEIDVFIEGSRPPNHKLPTPTVSRDELPPNMPPSLHGQQMPPTVFNKGPSLNSSSLGAASNYNMSAMQKVLQHKLMNEPPPSLSGGIALPGQMPPPPLPAMQTLQQQQAAQHLILQQINMAYKSGFIDKVLFGQLLSQQLPKRLLILVQQLLQQLTFLQNAVNTQQALQHNKNGLNPAVLRQKQEQCVSNISTIKYHIFHLQKKIKEEQNAGGIKPNSVSEISPSSVVQCGDAGSDALQQFNNLNIAMSSQPHSRLSVWKQRQTPDKEVDSASDIKVLHQSHSVPSMGGGAFEAFSYGDNTWSANTSASWPPPTSSDNAASASTVEKSDGDLTSSESSSMPTFPPEFIPGKLWQGTSNNNIEDDPHITPGSYTRSISVNTIKDDSLSNLARKSEAIDLNKRALGDVTPTSLTSQLWGAGVRNNSAVSRPPPGLAQQSKSWSSIGAGMQRQQSWAGTSGSAFTPVTGGALSNASWDRNISRTAGFWVILRNLSPVIDAGTLRTICQQHGPLLQFSMYNGQAMVQYSTRDEAIKAQKCLHNCSLGNVPMVAEFASDMDIAKMSQDAYGGGGAGGLRGAAIAGQTAQQRMGMHRKDSSSMWSQSSPMSTYSQYSASGGGGVAATWNNSLWAAGDDHITPNHMIGNLLGGESM